MRAPKSHPLGDTFRRVVSRCLLPWLTVFVTVTGIGVGTASGAPQAVAQPLTAGVQPLSDPEPPELSPDSTSSVVIVNVSALRSEQDELQPLGGAELRLYTYKNPRTSGAIPSSWSDYPAQKDLTVVGQDWASCKSRSDGKCYFKIPNTNSLGTNYDRQFWVMAETAPVGYRKVVESGPGVINQGGGSFSSITTPKLHVFPVGGRVSAGSTYTTYRLRSGQTYESGKQFMLPSAGSSTNTTTGVYTSGETTVWSSGVFPFVKNNPKKRSCGLSVALVLDLSGSVDWSNSTQALVDATSSIVDGLVGTPSEVAMFTFSQDAPASGYDIINGYLRSHPTFLDHRPIPQSVEHKAGANVVKSWYSNTDGSASFTPVGGTNWDRGLWAVVNAEAQFDIAVVLTDGMPMGHSGMNNISLLTNYQRLYGRASLEHGIYSANTLKSKGTRVLAVGVGPEATSATGEANLQLLSGPKQNSDFVLVDDYASAASAVSKLLREDCESTVAISMNEVPHHTTGEDITGATPQRGWRFDSATEDTSIDINETATTTSSHPAEFFVFLEHNKSGVTSAVFTPKPTTTQAENYNIVTQGGFNAVCVDVSASPPTPLPVTNTANGGFKIDPLPGGAAIECNTYYRGPSASVTVDHEWIVDGTHYSANDPELPDELAAVLTLTGPINSDSTNQEWGDARLGYLPLDTTTINTTVDTGESVYQHCAVSSTLTRANGVVISETLPYTTQPLPKGNNNYTITHTVDCTAKITILKHIGTPAGDLTPGDFVFNLAFSNPQHVRLILGSDTPNTLNTFIAPLNAPYAVTETANENLRYNSSPIQKYNGPIEADGSISQSNLYDPNNWVDVSGNVITAPGIPGGHFIYRIVSTAHVPPPQIVLPLAGGTAISPLALAITVTTLVAGASICHYRKVVRQQSRLT